MSKCGHELSMVTVVGIIKSVNPSPSNTEYEINDRTGPNIIVKEYSEQEVSDLIN